MNVLPDTNIRVLRPISELCYYDKQDTLLPEKMTALAAWNMIMSEPQPLLKIAFQIRDAISSVFSVKRIGGFSGKPANSIEIGQYLDFFLSSMLMMCVWFSRNAIVILM